jgi:hypothetical protein
MQELRTLSGAAVRPNSKHYVAAGMVERWGGTADVRVPGGSCWHCGAAIAYCVQIQSLVTGEQHEIGTTCAETRARRRPDQATPGPRNVPPSAGTLPVSGDTSSLRPHRPNNLTATIDRFHTGCYCLSCIDAVLAALPNEYAVATKSVVIDLVSGQPTRATLIDTRYGQSWRR